MNSAICQAAAPVHTDTYHRRILIGLTMASNWSKSRKRPICHSLAFDAVVVLVVPLRGRLLVALTRIYFKFTAILFDNHVT